MANNLFSVLVVVTLATTLITPPLLRLAFATRGAAQPSAEASPALVAEAAVD